ncbi:MAG: 39S ribosomal protein L45 [Desulfovibrio sp.]|jgi:predicted lipid-binding transport protein (Tim44 family)|nr:39S ribosomal protein L45 [Desulfovibrio sp.]
MRIDNRVFFPVFCLFCLLGAPLHAAAEEVGDSLTERLFAGSFTGSLLFGYPYTGAGTADMAAVAVLALLALRLIHAGRSRGKDEDRFTVDRKRGSSPESSGSGQVDAGRDDAGSNGRDSGGAPARRSRNSAWSRRTGGDPAAGDDDREAGGAPARRSRNSAWSRRMDGDPAAEDERGGPELPRDRQPDSHRFVTARDRAEAMWGYLRSDREQSPETPAEASVAPGVVLPDDFDAADFLQGARTLYIRLQKAWASRDITGLTPFVTPKLLETLRRQAEKNPEPVKTDIIMIDAELKDVRSDGETQTAQAAFNVLMRTGAQSEPAEVAELWTFERGPESQGLWRLCSIGEA